MRGGQGNRFRLNLIHCSFGSADVVTAVVIIVVFVVDGNIIDFSSIGRIRFVRRRGCRGSFRIGFAAFPW